MSNWITAVAATTIAVVLVKQLRRSRPTITNYHVSYPYRERSRSV